MNKLIKKGETRDRDSVILVLSLVFLVFFLITIFLVWEGYFYRTNELFNSLFSTPSSAFLINFCLILSFAFDPISVVVIAGILFVLLFMKGFKKEAIFILASSVLGGALIFILKEVMQIARPENLYESGFSFPSGHTVMSVILFCSLIYFSFRYTRNNYKYLISAVSFFSILLIVLSRIYLGVHWFSDVIGGAFLGIFVFLFTFYFLNE